MLTHDQEILCYASGTTGFSAIFPQLNLECVENMIKIQEQDAYEEGRCAGTGENESELDDAMDDLENYTDAVDDVMDCYIGPTARSRLHILNNYNYGKRHTVSELVYNAYNKIDSHFEKTGEIPSYRWLSKKLSINKCEAKKAVRVLFDKGVLVKNFYGRPMWADHAFNVEKVKDE